MGCGGGVVHQFVHKVTASERRPEHLELKTSFYSERSPEDDKARLGNTKIMRGTNSSFVHRHTL